RRTHTVRKLWPEPPQIPAGYALSPRTDFALGFGFAGAARMGGPQGLGSRSSDEPLSIRPAGALSTSPASSTRRKLKGRLTWEDRDDLLSSCRELRFVVSRLHRQRARRFLWSVLLIVTGECCRRRRHVAEMQQPCRFRVATLKRQCFQRETGR